jgi:redox-sensitive bicupin YhaK (pirin superfamily)
MVTRTLNGQATSDGAGVKLTRVIGSAALDHFDPFLLLDEFRSDDPNDYIAGFPDHPHRGFETVTYMLAGRMQHGDNQGNTGLLGPGSVQWMTAGRGIIHSEIPQQENGLMWGFQLWVNLPANLKMTAPRYQDIEADRVPQVSLGDVTVKVIAGEFRGSRGPVTDVPTDPLYLDLRMAAGASAAIPTPAGLNAFVYVYRGSLTVKADSDQALVRGQMGCLGAGDLVSVVANADAGFILVAARPLNEPVVRYGPFVMNTREEIQQAFSDYQTGRL